MASKSEKASVISTLRACILSCKGGVQINALDRDYRSLVGSPIPYRSLGYSTLEAFIRDSQDLYCTKGARGEMMVHAELNESSAHIAEMVNKQKHSGKPKARSRYPPSNWSKFSSKPRTSSSWKPPPTRYSAPARRTSPPPPPTLPARNSHLKSPLSITIEAEDSRSRKVVVDRRDNEGGRGSYELPPRFQRTEANLKKGPRFINAQPDTEEDLREKINKIKEKNKSEESSVALKTKDGNQHNETTKENETPTITRQPKFSTNIPEVNKTRNDIKKTPVQVVPRWIRSNCQEDEDDIIGVSYVARLEEFTTTRNLPDPNYKILTRVPKGGTMLYGCQVKVADQNYASYPDETARPDEAQELAAKKAYKKLMEIEKSALSMLNVTDDLDAIYARVTEIVNQFPGGVWSSEVMKIYADQHQENLPENWRTLIATCESISMTSTINGGVVLYPDTRQQTGDISGAEIARQLRNCEIDVPTEIESEITPIPEQILPLEANWDVFISNLVSSNAIYLRLIGEDYSDKYLALVDEIETYYSKGLGSQCPPENIELNSYYIGKLDGDWYRVCVLDALENGEYFNCHLIDIGECENFNKSNIYYMERQFCQLQPQAVLCCLAGIDDMEDSELCDKIVELLIGKTVVATVVERNDEKKDYSLTLHDTSVDPAKNLNEAILDLIDFMYQPLNLLKDSRIKQVYVSNIKENGHLYVQIQSAKLDELMKLSDQLDVELIERYRVPSCAFLKKDEKYLAKFSVDGNYYRAVLTGNSPTPKETEVELFFIDYGNVEKVNVTSISELQQLSPALYKIHPQAVEVALHDLEVDETGYKKLKELIPESDPVLLKVVKFEGAGPPEVEVFKRLVQDGGSQLISVHSTIVYEQSLTRNNQLRKSGKRSEGRKEQVSTTQGAVARAPQSPTEASLPRKSKVLETVHQSLATPNIPGHPEFFDVYISLAVSPDNFIVRPLETVQALGELTEEMTKFYTKHDNEFRVQLEDLIEGGLYAAFDDDEVHRVILASKVEGTMLSVYACDSGDYRIADVGDIRYLDQRFTKLPYQAIKAKVHGIRAVDGDWSTESCLYFQGLVVEKDLVSVVMDKEPDPLGKHEFVLSLMLIDTNSDVDVKIKNELIKNKIAVAS